MASTSATVRSSDTWATELGSSTPERGLGRSARLRVPPARGAFGTALRRARSEDVRWWLTGVLSPPGDERSHGSSMGRKPDIRWLVMRPVEGKAAAGGTASDAGASRGSGRSCRGAPPQLRGALRWPREPAPALPKDEGAYPSFLPPRHHQVARSGSDVDADMVRLREMGLDASPFWMHMLRHPEAVAQGEQARHRRHRHRLAPPPPPTPPTQPPPPPLYLFPVAPAAGGSGWGHALAPRGC